MKKAYPIILTPADEGGFVVYVPDFNINTQGEDEADAMDMARDAIAMTGCYWEDENRKIPLPSPITSIETQANEFRTLVDVDFEAYRKRNNNRFVKKSCSIPYWLNEEAEKAGINFSLTLQNAIKAQLGL